MNVLILGRHDINNALEKSIANEGFTSSTLKDAGEIVSFKGEPGAFTVKTADKELAVSGVIITQSPSVLAVKVGENKTYGVFDDNVVEKISAGKAAEKVVFLLDYETESQVFVHAKALAQAKQLADRKRKVFYMSKFVKTAKEDMEQLYADARAAGVTFVKYEKLDLSFNEDSGKFDIAACDGVFETKISTPYVISAAGFDQEEILAISKKLKLSPFNNSLTIKNKYYQYPALSGRKGVFAIDPNSAVCADGGEGLGFVFKAIFSELKQYAKEGEPALHAEVNPRKCAFCYNCFRICPHMALEPDLENSAMINRNNACQACGTCISVCPGEAITMVGEAPGLTEATISEGKGYKCKVFCCENSAEVALNAISLGDLSAKIDVTPISCGGRISLEMITTALTTYGKVLVATCVEDACRHGVGDKRACKQVERATEMLQKAGIGGKQAKCVKVSHAMQNILKEEIEAFIEG